MNHNIGRGILLLIFITLCVSIACQKWGDTGEWLDESGMYLCPDCRGNCFWDMVGTCERCDGGTVTTSFKYCYTCAKEIDACQCCGVAQWFWDIWH